VSIVLAARDGERIVVGAVLVPRDRFDLAAIVATLDAP
jgi:hypothetical protein